MFFVEVSAESWEVRLFIVGTVLYFIDISETCGYTIQQQVPQVLSASSRHENCRLLCIIVSSPSLPTNHSWWCATKLIWSVVCDCKCRCAHAGGVNMCLRKPGMRSCQRTKRSSRPWWRTGRLGPHEACRENMCRNVEMMFTSNATEQGIDALKVCCLEILWKNGEGKKANSFRLPPVTCSSNIVWNASWRASASTMSSTAFRSHTDLASDLDGAFAGGLPGCPRWEREKSVHTRVCVGSEASGTHNYSFFRVDILL